jgi:adenylate cyclase
MTAGQARAHAHDWPGVLTAITNPLVLNLDYLVVQLGLLLLFAGLLSLAVGRGRQLVEHAVRADQDINVLNRFFPPAVAQRLALAGGPSRLASETRAVAVLFADFDRGAPSAQALPHLEAFYGVCERLVFEHGGVIDRFVGDPVMATFGALEPAAAGSSPADQAWRCARALQSAQASTPFGLAGIGLNVGAAMCGEMGSERQRTFGVVGEVVNTARRMLDFATVAGMRGAIALTDAAAKALPSDDAKRLQSLGRKQVKGLDEPVIVWVSAP